MALLSIEDLHAGYETTEVLHGINLTLEAGTVTALLGANGAGKTTTLRTIIGRIRPTAGSIVLDGREITGLDPATVYELGVTLVPEDRGIFPELTVSENLRVPTGEATTPLERTFERFPELADRRQTKGRHLSGGEQQLLAIARALRTGPRVLLLDEPAEGLAPPAIERLIDVIETVVAGGTAVLLVEQNLGVAFEVASSAALITDGHVRCSGTVEELREREQLLTETVGIGSGW